MQTRVAITVTKVPLSGAEWGPLLQAPHCQPDENRDLDHSTGGLNATHRLQEVYRVEEYIRQTSTRCSD